MVGYTPGGITHPPSVDQCATTSCHYPQCLLSLRGDPALPPILPSARLRCGRSGERDCCSEVQCCCVSADRLGIDEMTDARSRINACFEVS